MRLFLFGTFTSQAFVEKLFSRLQSGGEKFDTRMALMALISRVVGVHK